MPGKSRPDPDISPFRLFPGMTAFACQHQKTIQKSFPLPFHPPSTRQRYALPSGKCPPAGAAWCTTRRDTPLATCTTSINPSGLLRGVKPVREPAWEVGGRETHRDTESARAPPTQPRRPSTERSRPLSSSFGDARLGLVVCCSPAVFGHNPLARCSSAYYYCQYSTCPRLAHHCHPADLLSSSVKGMPCCCRVTAS